MLSGVGEPLLADSPEALPQAGLCRFRGNHCRARQPIARVCSAVNRCLRPALFSGRRVTGLRCNQEIHFFAFDTLRLRLKDLLLIETDASYWGRMDLVQQRICVVEMRGQAQLALVRHHEGEPDDPGDYLYVELPYPEDEPGDKLIVVRLRPDGSTETKVREPAPPLPRTKTISTRQILGVCLMLVRR